jgi:DNA-binding phage protein
MEVRMDTDLLTGVAAIAEHLGMTKRQVYHLHHTGSLPTFHATPASRTVLARRSTLAAHFAAQEKAARHG